MARKVMVARTCDVDGKPDASPYPISAVREIDLCDGCRQDYLNLIAPYVEKSRPIRHGTKARAVTTVPRSSWVDPSKVRTWAREQGVPVPERGRLSKQVVDQYRAAHA